MKPVAKIKSVLNTPKRKVAAAGASVALLAALGFVTATVEGVFTATPQIFQPPASFNGVAITTDCSTDDTLSLGGWLQTVPNGTSSADSVVSLQANACYEIDGTIWWRGAQDIRINGHGATFKQATPDLSTKWAIAGGHDNPSVDPYCGSTDYANPGYSAVTSQPLTLVFEGGCDVTVNNLTFLGTHPQGGDPGTGSVGAFYQTCSFLTFYGTQRVLVNNVTMTGAYGDFIEFSGLHEAAEFDGDYPTTDATVQGSTFTDAGRTGVSETNGALRVLITKNTFTGANLSMFDIEYDSTVNKVIEGDINITGNTISGQNGGPAFGDLLSAQTGSELTDVAFTNNTLIGQAQIKIKLAPNSTGAVSSNVLISGNTAQTGSSWPFHPVTVTGMTNVLVTNNSDPPDQNNNAFASLNGSDPTNVACNNSNPITGAIDATCGSLPTVTAPSAPAAAA